MKKIWREENVQLLINTVKKHEHIWNSKHPLYTLSKRTRHDFWKEITNLFNACTGLKLKPIIICSKWNNLRACFQKETKKVSDGGLPCSRWKYYDMLTFLVDHPTRKQITISSTPKQYFLRKSHLKRVAHNETELVSVGSISPVNFQEEADQKTVRIGMNSIPPNLQGRSGMDSTFGDYVAAEIRHLELDLQMRAKKVIFDVLMELQYEQESRSRAS